MQYDIRVFALFFGFLNTIHTSASPIGRAAPRDACKTPPKARVFSMKNCGIPVCTDQI